MNVPRKSHARGDCVPLFPNFKTTHHANKPNRHPTHLVKLDDKNYVWHVRLRYGAKNSYGGYTLGNATVLYRAGKAAVYEMD